MLNKFIEIVCLIKLWVVETDDMRKNSNEDLQMHAYLMNLQKQILWRANIILHLRFLFSFLFLRKITFLPSIS